MKPSFERLILFLENVYEKKKKKNKINGFQRVQYGVWKVLGHNNLLFCKKINKKYQIFHEYFLVEGSMFKFYSTK